MNEVERVAEILLPVREGDEGPEGSFHTVAVYRDIVHQRFMVGYYAPVRTTASFSRSFSYRDAVSERTREGAFADAMDAYMNCIQLYLRGDTIYWALLPDGD